MLLLPCAADSEVGVSDDKGLDRADVVDAELPLGGAVGANAAGDDLPAPPDEEEAEAGNS
jgi:hypothetical protein